jgi:hypothetical protein
MWSAFDLLPVYVGRVGDGRVGEVFEECWGVREMPVGAVGEGELRAAKARFMEKRARERLRGNP